FIDLVIIDRAPNYQITKLPNRVHDSLFSTWIVAGDERCTVTIDPGATTAALRSPAIAAAVPPAAPVAPPMTAPLPPPRIPPRIAPTAVAPPIFFALSPVGDSPSR